MKKVGKILLGMILSVLLLQNSFFGIVFAQESQDDDPCVTCRMPSFEFQTYVNFQVEMLQILQKAKRKEKESVDIKAVGLFGSKILAIPESVVRAWSKMFKSEAEELTEGYRAVKMGAIMLGSMTVDIGGKVGGISILFRNEPFVREWGTLQDLEMSIHDAMWDLGMEGIWDDTVSSEIMSDILKLKQKYIKNAGNVDGLFKRFELNGSIKYKNITNVMLRLNSAVKAFVSMNNEAVNTSVFSRGGMTMQLNSELMDDMIASYTCAKSPSSCDSMFKDFADNTKVRKQISQGFDESKITIAEANERLDEAYLSFKSNVKDTFDGKENTELGLTTRQLELLRSVYGIDTTKLSKEQGIGLEKLLNGGGSKGLVNNVNLGPLDYFSEKNIAVRKETKKLKDQQKQDKKYLDSLTADETIIAEEKSKNVELEDRDIKILREELMNTLDIVLSEKQKDKELFLIYSNLSVTRYFVEIGGYIHDTVDDYIGTKDSKGLVKYMGNICEAQCSNKGTSNCYAK